jgi:archaellin
LVNTAGELQSRASDTGDDAQAQVSNQIDIVSATGENSDTDNSVENVTLVVKKSPGSDSIDLNESTIQYTSANESATLAFDSSGPSATNFTTASVAGGPTEVLDDTNERIKITIDVDAIESGLDEGASAELQIVDQSGASTVYGVNVPDVLTSDYVQV